MEEESPCHAVPYNYQIAQILVVGVFGIRPEVTIDIVTKWSNEHGGLPLERNVNKFQKRWDTYGETSGETDDCTLICELQSIANYAGTNLVPRHLESMDASLFHGGTHYVSWDSFEYVSSLAIFSNMKYRVLCSGIDKITYF